MNRGGPLRGVMSLPHPSNFSFENGVADFLSGLPHANTEATEYPKLVRPTIYRETRVVRMMNGGDLGDLNVLDLAEAGRVEEEYKKYVKANIEGT